MVTNMDETTGNGLRQTGTGTEVPRLPAVSNVAYRGSAQAGLRGTIGAR